MADKISPEERLFRVIRDGKTSPEETKRSENQKRSNINIRDIKGFFATLKSSAAAIQIQEVDPKLINKMLMVVLALLIILVIHYAVNKKPSVVKIINAISAIKLEAQKRDAVETIKPLSFYLEEVKKRDIFHPIPKLKKTVVRPVDMPKEKSPQEKLKEITANLKLRGISWGKSPKAMIKNDKEDKMYFLRQGQMIGSSGIEIKTILKNKVVITYEGVETELQ